MEKSAKLGYSPAIVDLVNNNNDIWLRYANENIEKFLDPWTIYAFGLCLEDERIDYLKKASNAGFGKARFLLMTKFQEDDNIAFDYHISIFLKVNFN